MPKYKRILTPVISPTIAVPLNSAFNAQHQELLLEGIGFFSKLPDWMSEKTKMIAVNDMWVTNSSESITRIGASSMLSSVAIAIHDPKKQVSGVVHALSVNHTTSPRETNTLVSLCPRMLGIAAVFGGVSYDITTFNLASGIRPPELTQFMRSALERFLNLVRIRSKVLSLTHRDEHNFILYSKDGSFYTA
jgi:hypothetical protein